MIFLTNTDTTIFEGLDDNVKDEIDKSNELDEGIYHNWNIYFGMIGIGGPNLTSGFGIGIKKG